MTIYPSALDTFVPAPEPLATPGADTSQMPDTPVGQKPPQSAGHSQNEPLQLQQHQQDTPPTPEEGQTYSRSDVPQRILSKEEQEEREMLDAHYRDVQEARQRQLADALQIAVEQLACHRIRRKDAARHDDPLRPRS